MRALPFLLPAPLLLLAAFAFAIGFSTTIAEPSLLARSKLDLQAEATALLSITNCFASKKNLEPLLNILD